MPWILLAAFVSLLVPSAATAQPAAAIADRFIHRAWGTADGLPQNSVTSMVQTHDGYLWIGTFGGLARFDGNTFTVFDPGNTPGLPSPRIVALHEDSKGALWIGTEAGLSRFAGGRFTAYGLKDGLPHVGITSIREDRQGRLWVGTGSQMTRFDGHTFSTLQVGGVFSQVGLSLAETADGMWAGVWNDIVRFSDRDLPTIVTHVGRSARSLLVDSRGQLWAGSDVLKRWDGSRFIDTPLPGSDAHHQGITALSEDHEGHLWIGTSRGGVYRQNGSGFEAFDTGDGLSDNAIRSILVDRDDNIWIGTDVGGLNRLKRRRVFSYQREGAIEQSIGPIVDDGADGLWIGATCGGLLHFRAGAFRLSDQKAGLTNQCFWALLRDPDGTLWVGSMGGGLMRFAGGKTRIYMRADGLPGDLVTALARDRDGTLLVGTDAGLSRFRDGRFTNDRDTDPTAPEVHTIAQDRSGTVWVGSAAGLFRIDAGRYVRITANGLSPDQVRAIYEDEGRTLWIGSYGGGLYRLKDGRLTSYRISDGLYDNAVSRIIEDEHGNLWMSGNKGVYRVARRQLDDFAEGRTTYITSVSYGVADGMIIAETNGGQPAGWRTADGRLWFPTIKGLVSIEPDTQPAAPPPVFVERIVAGGQPIDMTPRPSLGRGRADAEFHYTAVDLSTAEKTRFKYRLDGYDQKWIDGGARRVAFYTNIPPGDYRFEVMATSSSGAWSVSPAQVTFVVTPLWWQRGSVQLIGLALLLGTTGFGVRFISLRRARARMAALEREHALDRERSRIARDLHDDLGSRLSHIAMIADVTAGDGRIAGEVRDAARTMNELVWSVNARNDTVDGFAVYLAQFAEPHIAAAGVRCRLNLPPDLPARPLGAQLRRHLYLACKEAVNNAVKHAQASEIRVSLRVEGSRLVVEIADNGRGLPAEPDSAGNGLRNYRERMEAVGGTLDVQSAGNGTCITFSAPL